MNVVIRSAKRAVSSLLPRFFEKRRLIRLYHEEMTGQRNSAIDFLVRACRRRTFIDVGANRGCYSFHLKGHASRVIAFEPIPELCQQIALYNPEVEVRQVALSDETGSTLLHVPTRGEHVIFTRASLNSRANGGFNLKNIRVETARLDDYRFEEVGAIKIDVEGHELSVIRGATRTILTARPLLLVEIEERHNPGEAQHVIDHIVDLGYECFYFGPDGSLIPAESFDFGYFQSIDNLPDPVHGGGGLYVNDFMFVPLNAQ